MAQSMDWVKHVLLTKFWPPFVFVTFADAWIRLWIPSDISCTFLFSSGVFSMAEGLSWVSTALSLGMSVPPLAKYRRALLLL